MRGGFNGIVAVFAIVTNNNVGFVNGFVNPMATEKDVVAVYYETLCPDTRDFFVKQVKPTVNNLRNRLTNVYFDMVPYGKATTTVEPDGSISFQCQHGPKECERNIHHACVVKRLDILALNVHIKAEMVACLFEKVGVKPSGDIDEATRKCAAELNLTDPRGFMEKVKKCKNSDDGSKHLKHFGEKTYELNPPLYFIPWITFKGKWSKEIQDASLQDLQGTVCKQLLPGIPECKESPHNFRN